MRYVLSAVSMAVETGGVELEVIGVDGDICGALGDGSVESLVARGKMQAITTGCPSNPLEEITCFSYYKAKIY